MTRRVYRQWEPKDYALLDELIHCHPIVSVVRIYRTEAKKRGLLVRTELAIRQKARVRYGHILPIYEKYLVSTLANALGVSVCKVRHWVKSGYLKTKKIRKSRAIITKSALNDFAKNHPDLLSPLDWHLVAGVFGETVANQVQTAPLPNSHPIPIRRKSDNKIFPSIRAALKENNICRRRILREIAAGKWEKMA